MPDSQGVEDLEKALKVDAADPFQNEGVLVALTFCIGFIDGGKRERRREDLRVALEMVAWDLEDPGFDLGRCVSRVWWA